MKHSITSNAVEHMVSPKVEQRCQNSKRLRHHTALVKVEPDDLRPHAEVEAVRQLLQPLVLVLAAVAEVVGLHPAAGGGGTRGLRRHRVSGVGWKSMNECKCKRVLWTYLSPLTLRSGQTLAGNRKGAEAWLPSVGVVMALMIDG